MRPSRLLPASLTDCLRRLGLDKRGIAVVEFAMILPLLLAMFLGLSEMQPGYAIMRKLDLVTRTVADLSARSAKITTSELKTVFGAATAIMRPYDGVTKSLPNGVTQLVVSWVEVKLENNVYVGKVVWSCPWNLPIEPEADDLKKRADGSKVEPLPESFNKVGKFMLTEALFPYSPSIGYTITKTIKLKRSQGWDVRDAAAVDKPTSCPT